jgi:hypothetical protein
MTDKAPKDACADPRAYLAAAMIALLAASLAGLLFLPVPASNRDIIIAIVSVGVVASVKDVIGFYFGSSAGSTQKDATIATMAANAPEVGPVEPIAKVDGH